MTFDNSSIILSDVSQEGEYKVMVKILDEKNKSSRSYPITFGIQKEEEKSVS